MVARWRLRSLGPLCITSGDRRRRGTPAPYRGLTICLHKPDTVRSEIGQGESGTRARSCTEWTGTRATVPRAHRWCQRRARGDGANVQPNRQEALGGCAGPPLRPLRIPQAPQGEGVSARGRGADQTPETLSQQMPRLCVHAGTEYALQAGCLSIRSWARARRGGTHWRAHGRVGHLRPRVPGPRGSTLGTHGPRVSRSRMRCVPALGITLRTEESREGTTEGDTCPRWAAWEPLRT